MAYKRGMLKLEENGKQEIVFNVARHLKKLDLGVGWPTIVDYSPAGSDAIFTGLSFAKTDQYTEQFHLPHGADFSLDSIDVDFHYMMTTADTAKVVKMKLSLWHAYIGRDISALGAADADYTWSFTPNANDYIYDEAYVEDAIDLSAWQTNRNIHDGIIVRMERLDGGDGDTHDGEVFLMHNELWLPTDGRIVLST